MTCLEAIDSFPSLSILCVGDLALDKYIEGRVERLSPEAPCPIILNAKESSRPGCTGNVASNLSALDAKVFVVGTLGDDGDGAHLKSLLQIASVGTGYIVTDSARPTTCKTRIMSSSHHFVRLDREVDADCSTDTQAGIITAVTSCLAEHKVSGIILSDYDKGVLTPRVIEAIIDEAQFKNIPVVADPKKRHFWNFTGVDVLKPNIDRMASVLGTGSDLQAMAGMVRRKLLCSALVVTQGASGMTVFSEAGSTYIPAKSVAVSELSGAGDTAAAVITLGIAAGLTIVEAARLANLAASVVVGKSGTATVSTEELVALLPTLE